MFSRYSGQTTSYQILMDGNGNRITFYESLTLDDETYTENNFAYSTNNYIYLDTSITFDTSNIATQYGSNGTVSNEDAQIIFTFYDSRLGLYDTEVCYEVHFPQYNHYGVQDRTTDWDNYSFGEWREYGTPLSGTPAYTVTIKNAGYTSTGETIDFVFTLQYGYVERKRSMTDSNDTYPCFMHFREGEAIFELFSLEAAQEYAVYEINISFYYSSGDKAGKIVDDAEYVFEVADMDVASTYNDGVTNEWSNQYSEAIWLIDGFDNPIELTKSPVSMIEPALKSFTGSSSSSVGRTEYANLVRITQSDNAQSASIAAGTDSKKADETIVTGFMTEITSGSFTFLWTGCGCGTNLTLTAGGYGSPPVEDPVKTVNKTEASLGETITYTVTETIPYTSSNDTSSNVFTSIVFTDTLDAALDINSTTVTVYRTDTLNGSTRASDISNWNITKIGQTITATCINPSDAGGEYEFVITTKISSDADLSGYSTTTTSSGAEAYVISNTATIAIDSTSLTSPPVTIVVKANVEYELVSMTNPSDSVLPSSVTTYAGSLYTIEDGLTTSDTSAVWYFNGWYYDSALTEPASGTITLPAGTTTLYGEWLISEIELVKTATTTLTSDVMAGDKVNYRFTITNTGGTTLTNIALYDEKLGGNITVGTTTLAPGRSTTVNVEYTLTQEDVDAGYVYNTATVTGVDPGNSTVTSTDDETIDVPCSPNIDLVKIATVDVVENAWAGTSTITYIFTVTNTGNVTLDDIVLTDPLLGGSALTLYYASDITSTVTTLAPGEKAIAAATYVVTQDDIDAGIVENTATVVGDDPHDDPAEDTDDKDVEVERLPSIDLVKEVIGDTVIEDAYAGDWVQFAVTITNTGNTTLYNATIYDLLEGAAFVVEELEGVTFTKDNTVVVEKMSPEDSVTVYVDYQLTQADIDRGDTENIASVVADPPTGLEQVTDEDDAEIETPSNPSISLVKTANVESIEFALPGDVIYYTLTVTNTGNTTLSNLTLYDELLAGELEVFVVGDADSSEDEDGVSVEEDEIIEEDDIIAETDAVNTGYVTEALDKTIITPGESAVAIISYRLTQDDIDAGYVYNTALATGEDPHGTGVEDEDDYTVELIANPSIMLTKTVAAANDIADEDLTVGDELTYTFVIANNGNRTITDITLYDDLLGGNIDLTNAVKGIDMTVIGYEAAEDEADSSDAIDSDAVVDDDDTNEASENIGDDLPLASSDVEGSAGEAIVEQETSVEETDESVVSDDTLTVASRAYYTEHTEVSEDDPITTLRPGEYLIIEVNYTLTQDDLNNGRVDNTATVTGTAPDGSSVSDEDTAVMYLPQHPSIELIKDASLETLAAASVGDVINYTLTITNTGDVSLQNLVVTDELEGIVIDMSGLDGLVLAPGETVVVTAEYALTANDLAVGSVYNHATVVAESVVPYDEENIWSGAQQVSDDDDALVDGIVAVADDLILPQTGENLLLLLASALVGLLTAGSIAATNISRRRCIK